MLLALLHYMARARAFARRFAPGGRFVPHQWGNASDPNEGEI